MIKKPSLTIVISDNNLLMQHAHSRYRTNEMRLYNIIHLTRKHLFDITLVPVQTEHYILANTGIATTIINTIVRNKFDNV